MDLATFRSLYPELSSLSDALVTHQLALATEQLGKNVFCNEVIRQEMLGLLAAHGAYIKSLGTSNQAGQVVTSDKVGDLSRTFANPFSSSAYAATSYGREFQRLLSLHSGAFTV